MAMITAISSGTTQVVMTGVKICQTHKMINEEDKRVGGKGGRNKPQGENDEIIAICEV